MPKALWEQTDEDCLVCSFMDVNWQYNDPPNPADAAVGPQGYDNHLYYNYGVRPSSLKDVMHCPVC